MNWDSPITYKEGLATSQSLLGVYLIWTILDVVQEFELIVCWFSAKEKSPSLDDGGDGFPPRDDGDGGGGGGGGGNWSGGFFFFGFLAFLGLLKDKEGEEDYRGSRRR